MASTPKRLSTGKARVPNIFQSFEDASTTLFVHSGHAVIPLRESLVGSLRPYAGIKEVHFYEVILSLISLHKHLSEPEHIDRKLVYACWDLNRRIRILALEDYANLKSNNLVSDHDLERLRQWAHAIESFGIKALHQLSVGSCLLNVLEYVTSDVCPNQALYKPFLPLLEMSRTVVEFDHEIEIIGDAIVAIQKASGA